MVNVPVCAPGDVGMKVTATVQPVLAASVAWQVLAEILNPAPATVGICSVTVAAPVLEMVMFRAALVALTAVDGKATATGSSTTAAAGEAVPESDAVACPPGTLP
jgi:hypothetical protein